MGKSALSMMTTTITVIYIIADEHTLHFPLLYTQRPHDLSTALIQIHIVKHVYVRHCTTVTYEHSFPLACSPEKKPISSSITESLILSLWVQSHQMTSLAYCLQQVVHPPFLHLSRAGVQDLLSLVEAWVLLMQQRQINRNMF